MGAVASMHSIKSAISVARKVLEHSSHTLLVGRAATKFAIKFGFKSEPLETENSNRQHHDWQSNNCQPNFWHQMAPDPSSSCGPYKPINSKRLSDRSQQYSNQTSDIRNHDTIGMVAIDSEGRMATGTSTNGASHKIPG